jgi:hypothetical protein
MNYVHHKHARIAIRRLTSAALSALMIATGFLFLSDRASALEVIDYFGTKAGSGSLGGQFIGARDIAVNYTGAGPANSDDVYVADGEGLNGGRIQRFVPDDNGTPSEPYDDFYEFVSAWGADVVQAGGIGDQGDAADGNFEICVVATQCKAAALISGNGTIAGNGAMFPQGGIAVDQDTGRVYVSDGINFTFGTNAKVNVYEGDGTFLYSFGFDVDATEPGTGYEVCPANHVCKEGVRGKGLGQVDAGSTIAISPPDGNPVTGKVFLADDAAHRIGTYDLDGGNPSSIGSNAEFTSGPLSVAVDSRGVVYADRGMQEILRYDSENANGGGVGFLAPIASPPRPDSAGVSDLEVDPDTDGPGPDEGALYVLPRGGAPATVQQFGPLNDPGLVAPPVAEDDHHGELVGFKTVGGLGLDAVTGRLFVSADYRLLDNAPANAPPSKHGVYVLGPSGGAPSTSIDAIGNVTATSATIDGTINPNSGPSVGYSLEYSRDGVDWLHTEKVPLGVQTTDQPVAVVLDPPGAGLEPNTLYHVRLVATKAFAAPVVSTEQTFTTDAESPQVETSGSSLRTVDTALLEGRVIPRNLPTNFHFEYIEDQAYQANLSASNPPFTGASSTPSQSAGAGSLTKLVAAGAEGLQPDSTYHYRLVAGNGGPGGPSVGEEMLVTTRASDAPLQHGRLPGPTGSDRAYEQVNLANTGGNPVAFSMGFSDDGNRALYSIAGGTPISDTGSLGSVYYAERESSGWQTRKITPPRAELFGGTLSVAGATSDISSVLIENLAIGTAGAAIWGLAPAGTPSRLFQIASGQKFIVESAGLSADGSRAVAILTGAGLDPGHPGAALTENIYDVSSGAPELVSLLPGDLVASCGSASPEGAFGPKAHSTSWVSANGRFVFFSSSGNSCTDEPQLYLRDLVSDESKLISGPPTSGNACGAALLKSTPGAVFFWTQSQLVSADTPNVNCTSANGGDVYRYEFTSETLKCVTCVAPGLDANVLGGEQSGSFSQIAVADDGSRVYFTAVAPLSPGAPANGSYRVDVSTGELVYVGRGRVGASLFDGNAITPDGSVLIFRSDDPGLNPVDGLENDGTRQYYRYDDRDRSLVCISCPQDGDRPFAGIPAGDALSVGSLVGPNSTPVSDDGEVVAFAAPTALVAADQNTPDPGSDAVEAATDVYEWRDGRPFLITDGLTNWSRNSEPTVAGVAPSGKDVYFLVAAQYTQDALDGYRRLYDARIGGGFEFPPPSPPCPLEVCQGTPKGVPQEQEPGSGTFNGLGDRASDRVARRCPKGRRRVRHAGKTRCVKQPARQRKAKEKRANHERRAAR